MSAYKPLLQAPETTDEEGDSPTSSAIPLTPIRARTSHDSPEKRHRRHAKDSSDEHYSEDDEGEVLGLMGLDGNRRSRDDDDKVEDLEAPLFRDEDLDVDSAMAMVRRVRSTLGRTQQRNRGTVLTFSCCSDCAGERRPDDASLDLSSLPARLGALCLWGCANHSQTGTSRVAQLTNALRASPAPAAVSQLFFFKSNAPSFSSFFIILIAFPRTHSPFPLPVDACSLSFLVLSRPLDDTNPSRKPQQRTL